ncbi:hypothetical protein KBD08_00400 [Candidatus Babeliales bacterium]|nr:hypothetical protein [Candidatus Babeliales bacterium]
MNNKILLWVMCTMFSSEFMVASKQPKKPKAVAASPVKGKQSAKKSKQQYDSEDELLDQKSAEIEQFQQQQEQQRALRLQKEQQKEQQEEQEKQRALKLQKEKREEKEKHDLRMRYMDKLLPQFLEAIEKRSVPMLQDLYEQGFDFNTDLFYQNFITSCLYKSIDSLDLFVIRFLIDHGANPSVGAFFSRTRDVESLLYQLMIVMFQNDKVDLGLPIFNLLLERGASPDIGRMKYEGSENYAIPEVSNPSCFLTTPLLSFAIAQGYVNIVKTLLDAGANPNNPYVNLDSGIDESLFYIESLLYMAILKQHGKPVNTDHDLARLRDDDYIITLLLDHSADINQGRRIQDSYHISPLFMAVMTYNASALLTLLKYKEQRNLNVNLGYQHEYYYETPLSRAIICLNDAEQHQKSFVVTVMKAMIILLIEAGADVNKGSYVGTYEESPFQNILKLQHYEEICDALLKAGADINIPNSITGFTIPFERVTTYMDLRSKYPDNTDFLRELRAKLYYVLKLESYVDVFHEVQGYNILDNALLCGFGQQEKDVIKILVSKGLNPIIKNRDGKNTYDKLIERDRLDLIQQLNAILDTMGADFVAMQYVEPLIKQEQLTDLVQDEPVSPVVSASTSPVTSPTKTELKKQKKAEKLEKKALMVEQESKQVVEPKVIETTILPKAKSPARLREMTIESIKISRGVDVADRQQGLQVVEKALRVTPIDPALIAKYLTLQNNKTIKNIDWIHILLPVVDMVYSLRLKKYNPSFSGSHTSRAIDSLVQAQCVESMQEEVMDNGCVVCRLKNLFTGDFFIKTIFPKSWTDEQIMKSVTVADIKNSVIDSKTGNIEMSLAFQDPQTAKTILMRAIAVKDFVLGMLKIITVYPVKSFDDQEKTLQAFAGHTVPAIA